MGVLDNPQIIKVRPDGEDAWSLDQVEDVLQDIRDVLHTVEIKINRICRDGDLEIWVKMTEYSQCPPVTNTLIDRIGIILSATPAEEGVAEACV